MVLLDDKPTPSCLMPASLAQGCEIRTVEGLGAGDTLNTIQQALEACDAVQCGMCFPGVLMSLTALLARVPAPGEDAVRDALVGNICRCTGYEQIVEAALAAREEPR